MQFKQVGKIFQLASVGLRKIIIIFFGTLAFASQRFYFAHNYGDVM